MHLYRVAAPCTGVVTKTECCTAGRKAAGFCRHIEIDVSGTSLVGQCQPGQSIGVLPPGLDEHGKAHKLRLYSLANPTGGEDGQGRIISTTVKRTIDEHWDSHRLFLGVCSNYLCDLEVGAKVTLTGPSGKKFILPQRLEDHDYLFFATGTGIAPFRGMVTDILRAGTQSRVTLVMGSPYATDLLYDLEFREAAARHPRFTYLTAVSRDPGGRLYVQDRLRTHREDLEPLLKSERTLVYICGVAGMELGIFQEMARVLPASWLDHYMQVDPAVMRDIDSWQRTMLHKQVHLTRRVLMEVYA